MTMTLGTAEYIIHQAAQGEKYSPEGIKAAQAVVDRWTKIRAKRAAAKKDAAAPAPVAEAAPAIDPKKAYANMHGYTDIEPYEVVRVVSEQTMEIRRMTAKLSNGWKPDISPGGFAGHCNNQETQTYDYTSDESAPIVRIRKVKPKHSNRMMTWKSAYGHHRLSDKPCKFHDYNF